MPLQAWVQCYKTFDFKDKYTRLYSYMTMMANICEMFATRCIDGLMMNNDMCSVQVFNNISLVTVLNPHLGYDSSTYVARKAKKQAVVFMTSC